MTTATDRAARIERLYALKREVDDEIARIEAEIDAEVRAMRRAKAAANRINLRTHNRPVATCGTDGGYYRHRRTLLEPACDACKLAHRVAERERAARRLARRSAVERLGWERAAS